MEGSYRICILYSIVRCTVVGCTWLIIYSSCGLLGALLIPMGELYRWCDVILGACPCLAVFIRAATNTIFSIRIFAWMP